MSRLPIRKIVSGGQTGVDRGALDAAICLGIEHGGWCPKGRRAEDGTIPSRYLLTENHSTNYAVRTEQNVLASDGTLILTPSKPTTGGTALTERLARQFGKPLLVLTLRPETGIEPARQWIVENHLETLNVAGPRESDNPGAQSIATELLIRILR